jgi:carbamate kinase
MATAPDKLAVVAVGGNSLIVDADHVAIPYQAETAAVTAGYIAQMVADGWNVVVTHGNGPQVGFILQRSELGKSEIPTIPMNYATSNTQGSIGYMFQRSLLNEFRRRGLSRSSVALVTQVLVDHDDPDFHRPTKPIGPFLDEQTAHLKESEHGWQVIEDSGRGWRRVVPSPRPIQVLELGVIADLVNSGNVVIACGGGGLPVYLDDDGELKGVEAVVDKDYASSLVAQGLHASLFLISTSVEKIALHYNTPQQRWLDSMTATEARGYLAEGHFAAGSMGPKVEAIVEFVEATGGIGVVTNPENLSRALAGETGTRVVPD